MADVRSLLRNELASRTGTSQTGSTGNRVTKKRKVDTGHDLTRKKPRAGNVEEEQQVSNLNKLQPPSAQAIIEEDVQTERESAGPELPSPAETRQEAIHEPSDESPVPPKESTETSQAIDEDEWAAFERDVVAPTRLPQASTAVAAAVTISAAPISTEQLAAQQEKENETLAQAREAEAEGEREDAARFLEDEFDEMEQLEERVRRLKQKREELRQKRAVEDAEAVEVDGSPSPGAESNEQRKDQAGTRNGDDEGDDDVDDDEDDDDDWDDWRLR